MSVDEEVDDLVRRLVERGERVEHRLWDERQELALEVLDEVGDVEIRLDQVPAEPGACPSC